MARECYTTVLMASFVTDSEFIISRKAIKSTVRIVPQAEK